MSDGCTLKNTYPDSKCPGVDIASYHVEHAFSGCFGDTALDLTCYDCFYLDVTQCKFGVSKIRTCNFKVTIKPFEHVSIILAIKPKDIIMLSLLLLYQLGLISVTSSPAVTCKVT